MKRRTKDFVAVTGGLTQFLATEEKWWIAWALRQTQGHITWAAKLLGLGRTTLSMKMKKYKISKKDYHDGP